MNYIETNFKRFSTLVAITILFFLSPVSVHTNALDSALIMSGSIVYESESPVVAWFYFPNTINQILSVAISLGISPLTLSLGITLIGLGLWFFAYFVAAKSFSISHMWCLVFALVLTAWNPFLSRFSSAFSYQPPWIGNSTYGMLGLALVAFGMALCLVGKYRYAFAIGFLSFLVSPINGVLLLFVLLTVSLNALIVRDFRLFLELLVGFFGLVLVTTWSALEVYEYRQSFGMIDIEVFNTYLTLWDSHRNPDRYTLSFTQMVAILSVSAVGLSLSRYSPLLKVSSSIATKRALALFGMSLSSLLPVAYWAFNGLLSAFGGVPNQSHVLFIQEMPLRATSITGFVLTVIIFAGIPLLTRMSAYRNVAKIFLRFPESQRTLVILLIMIFSVGISFRMAGFYSKDSWLEFLWSENVGHTVSSKGIEPNDIGMQVRANGHAGVGLTVVAPGLSHQALWGAKLPILLHTENGIDFLGYLPQLTDDVRDIVDEVYGLNFSKNPKNLRCGCISNSAEIRRVWEGRANQEWKGIMKKFGVRYVFVPTNWVLGIPRIAVADGVTVYEIR